MRFCLETARKLQHSVHAMVGKVIHGSLPWQMIGLVVALLVASGWLMN